VSLDFWKEWHALRNEQWSNENVKFSFNLCYIVTDLNELYTPKIFEKYFLKQIYNQNRILRVNS
jgi:hypothetical protein